MRVGAIPRDLIGTTTYSASTPHLTYDVAYDMWLNNSGTTKPCNTDGTVEVMVWTDYDEQALLPASSKVGTASIPYSVDGVEQPAAHNWSMYVSNIYPGGRTVPWGGTVWLVLNQVDAVHQGTVSVDLSAALSAVGMLLQNNFGWSDFAGTYWLDTVPFGMEFGPEDASITGAGPTSFSLRLSSYCLSVRSTVSTAVCGLLPPG